MLADSRVPADRVSESGVTRGSGVVDLVIVGGGASGLACAVAGSCLGLAVLLLEKMDCCGRKLALTGGQKCNFTHEESPRDMARRFDCDSRLLMPLLRRFPFQRIEDFFATRLGIEARSDEAGCVWPQGVAGAAVRDRLIRAAREHGVEFRTGIRVTGIEPTAEGWTVATAAGRVHASNLLLATGGASLPRTGSTGDGLGLCRELGLATANWFPALASLRPARSVAHLAGNTRRNVSMELHVAGRSVRAATGHFIFAHEYISGSAILNLSGFAARGLAEARSVRLVVDWVPERNADRLRSELDASRQSGGARGTGRRRLVNVLATYLSRRFALDLLKRCAVPVERVVAEMTRAERERVVGELKATRFDITGTEPIERATVTGGGLSLDEVELASAHVRRFRGLHVSGELLDTWAETGGYNLHFAWATGIAAAERIAGKELR